MKNPPTYEDAKLIIKLYDLRREPLLREARKWFGAVPQFLSRAEMVAACPPGSQENAYMRMVSAYWDMCASLVVTGVLNRELFYRSSNQELLFVWEKVKNAVPEMREASKNPFAWSQIEDVANGYIEFYNQHAPGFYENFAAGIAKIGR
jgi:L-rhamnose mutarotase